MEVFQEATEEFIRPQLWPLRSLNLVANSMWELMQEKVYKTHITDLDVSTTALMNGCDNDDMIQLGPLQSQSMF